MTFQQTQLKQYREKSEQIQSEIDNIDDRLSKSLCDIQNARMEDRKIRLRTERDNYLAAVKDINKRGKKIPLE